MRIGQYHSAARPPEGPPIRVLIFYDEVGWAWWHRAGQIRKNISPDILVSIQKIDEPFNHHDFDLFLLFDAQLLAHIAHVPREKIILGSSCPMLTPEAMAILKHERCAAGLLNSLGAYEEFRQEGKIYCCQNGVDTQLFQPPTRAVEPWVACWVGNSKSIGNKGLDLIREACRSADVRLLVVDKAELGQAAALMTQEEVRDRIYHQASFYICASESEGTPNPMLEAMACGLPAVSTRVGNAPELIRAGYNGFLAERNVAGLVEAILRLKACNFADLSRQARQSILDGWTWRQQALKYQTAFRELAAENRAHPGNPKTAYRNILWVDGAPPQGPWDPVSVIKALQAKYPDAAISICCEHSTEARYQGCDGIRTLIPFDRSRAGADSAYRMGILQRLQALDVDLAFNGSCRSDLVVDLLVLGSTRMERIACRPFLARHNAALQAELTPLYTRLFATEPLLEGTGRQVLDMLAKAGVSGAPQAADSSAFDIRPAAAQPSVPDWNSRPAPPRILMVVHMFPPYWFAGVEVYTYHLAQSLRAQGVDVSVFYPIIDQKKAVPEILKSTYGGVPVFTLVHNGTGADFFNIEHPVIDRLFGELLDREDFQIVHFQHTICLSFRLPEIARSRGKRLCLTLHDFWMMCQRVHFYIEPEHK
ncbi:MAG: hypothetical protein JWO30_2741, partial [Fibrobacteres bacterium]|nr:hypothetical protein [Fibrobacterota bacterium]